MAYIIDGHNLIGILPNISLAQPDDEARLIDLLLSYRARGAREMIVFFDASPFSAGGVPTRARNRLPLGRDSRCVMPRAARAQTMPSLSSCGRTNSPASMPS